MGEPCYLKSFLGTDFFVSITDTHVRFLDSCAILASSRISIKKYSLQNLMDKTVFLL